MIHSFFPKYESNVTKEEWKNQIGVHPNPGLYEIYLTVVDTEKVKGIE